MSSEGSGLVPFDWNGKPVPIGTNITYQCGRGGRFDEDEEMYTIMVQCLENNTWDVPDTWPTCVPSNSAKFKELRKLVLIQRYHIR